MTDSQLEMRVDELARQGYRFWADIADLERYAESDSTRKYIHDKAVALYHREEASCGLL